MKFIKKGKEPAAWKAKRETEGTDFSAIPELQLALLKEQGYICCYCMSQIHEKSMKVEHWRARSKYPEKKFDYNNLLAACKGDFCSDKHCDTKKENDEIELNPTDAKNNVELVIGYSWSDGKLTYPSQYKTDIEVTLNLNNAVLCRNRKSALNAVNDVLKIKKYSKGIYEKQLLKLQSKNSEGKYSPYCMIGIRFLEKKIKQFH